MNDDTEDPGLLQIFLPNIAAFRPGHYGWPGLRGDIFGGLTAAVVALPLALAFGVASGAGPIAGLYGAVAVGFFAAIFGGTPAQVSGPTGPMTVVMGALIVSHTSTPAEAFTIVMLGGLLQIVFGVLRLGKYVIYTPYSVVSGFMTGIGVIIMIIQILPFCGLPTSQGGVLGTLSDLTHVTMADLDVRVPLLALATLALIIAWPARLQRIVPAPLAALILGTLASTLIVTGIPELGTVPSGLPAITRPTLSLEALPHLFQGAFVLALLGSIDSLLTSLVADTVTRSRHNSSKELVGQGIGNLVSGLIGGLPGAGATMRTMINIRSGGRTPVSGALHALVLLAMAAGLGPIVAHVPHAVLAAILMKVGWDIIDWGHLRKMRRAPREKFIIMLITLGLTVFVDLITAVAVGIILAGFVNSRRTAIEQLKGITHTAHDDEQDSLTTDERVLLRRAGGKVVLIHLHGSFSYASARDLSRRAAPKVSGHQVMIYDFAQTGYIDTSAALAIDEMFAQAEASNQKVIVCGLQGSALETLDGLDVLKRVPDARRFADRKSAIEAAVNLVEQP